MENVEKIRTTADDEMWMAGIQSNKQGLYLNNANNIHIHLHEHPECKGVLRYNRFTHVVEIISEPPWALGPDTYPRPMQDVDTIRATAWLEKKPFTSVSSTTVFQCIVSAAHANSYNPLQNYLFSLAGKWDNTRRVEDFFIRALGAMDNEYTRTIARLFLVGAIARAMEPGCKMDNMLILEGKQGLKKSTAIADLFGRDWFTDDLADLGSKDAAMQIQGVWVVEISELSSMNRADYSRTKEWITRSIDKFRAPYGRTVQAYPRQCVFIGTVNPEEGYLKDPTGARRFWPVTCTNIDIPYIKKYRDQIWAEALYMYSNNDRWWLEESETHITDEEQSSRYDEDPWTGQILDYSMSRHSVTTDEILADCLRLPATNRTVSAKKRVASVLIQARFTQKRVRVNGRQVRVYYKDF